MAIIKDIFTSISTLFKGEKSRKKKNKSRAKGKRKSAAKRQPKRKKKNRISRKKKPKKVRTVKKRKVPKKRKIKQKVKKSKRAPKRRPARKRKIVQKPKVRKKKAARKKASKISKPKAVKSGQIEDGTPIGELTHYFSKIEVVVIKIKKGNICIGDKLRITGKNGFFIQKVKSLQIESVDVKAAKKGSLVGLKVGQAARVGTTVYKL